MSFKHVKLSLATLLVLAIGSLVNILFSSPPVNAGPPTQLSAACQLQTKGFSASRAIFTPWYKYLNGDNSSGACRPDFKSDQIGSTVIKIGSAVLELALNVSALIAATFFIWGAIQYVTSQGDPNGLTTAKSTITNAIVGLVITVLASGIVQFVGNSLRG